MEKNKIELLNPQCIYRRKSAIKNLIFGEDAELTREWFENYVHLPQRFTMMIKDNIWDFTLNELKFEGATRYHGEKLRDRAKEGFVYYDSVIHFIVNIFGSCDELKKSKTENFLLPIKFRRDMSFQCYSDDIFRQESYERQYAEIFENSSDPIGDSLAYHSRVMKAMIMLNLEEKLETLYSKFYMVHEIKDMICNGGI